MDFSKLENTLDSIYDFNIEFNTFTTDMRELVKEIDLPYQDKYVDLLFELYSSVYELAETHDMDEMNLDTLAKDYWSCVESYSNYVKFLNMIGNENRDYVSNFNYLKDIMDCIKEIDGKYLEENKE